jgi:hypothetical protein
MTKQMKVEHYLLTFDGAALRIRNTVSKVTVCIRPGELDLLVELIGRVAWERREATRIPVVDRVLAVQLGLTAGVFAVKPIDVSVGGMQVSCVDTRMPDVDVNELVTIHVTYRDEKATGAGMVRRVDGQKLGISFVDDGRVDNTGLRMLLDTIETEWLDQRLFGKAVK